jgi:hypothetical protein
MFIIHIHRDHCMHIKSFMQLGFNLSNGVTDTLDSSILIYKEMHKGLYTQRVAKCSIDEMVDLKIIKRVARSLL